MVNLKFVLIFVIMIFITGCSTSDNQVVSNEDQSLGEIESSSDYVDEVVDNRDEDLKKLNSGVNTENSEGFSYEHNFESDTSMFELNTEMSEFKGVELKMFVGEITSVKEDNLQDGEPKYDVKRIIIRNKRGEVYVTHSRMSYEKSFTDNFDNIEVGATHKIIGQFTGNLGTENKGKMSYSGIENSDGSQFKQTGILN